MSSPSPVRRFVRTGRPGTLAVRKSPFASLYPWRILYLTSNEPGARGMVNVADITRDTAGLIFPTWETAMAAALRLVAYYSGNEEE